MRWFQKIKFLAASTILFVLIACAHTETEIAPDVKNYLMGISTWEEFAPLAKPIPKSSQGSTTKPQQLDNAYYVCTTTEYTLRETPEKIVMYSPDVEILWPGALIQGKSHKEPGSLLGLIVKERKKIKVSIPALPNEENYREVKPDQAEVMRAIGGMIGKATMDKLKIPSTITFEMNAYHSEEEFALSAGISGKYLGFKASASTEIDSTASETIVAVHLYQKMFEVVVEPPQTPTHFFSAEFTWEKLQEQIDLGRIDSKTNIPVYVSNVVYGRMMMFTVTSTASESEIKAALNASYKSLTAEAEVDLDARHKQVLNKAKISITSLGGPAAATEAMIRSGNWQDYFTDDTELSTAAPLSYTFRNLVDGSIAKVSESTKYSVRECNLDSMDYILASFENGTENWKVPGAKGKKSKSVEGEPEWIEGEPEWIEWLNDDQSIMNNYIKAYERLGNFYYFKAPQQGFLEFINDQWYNGKLSYWLRTESLGERKGFSMNWYIYGDDIYLVGRNGITLSYQYNQKDYPDWRGYECAQENDKDKCKKRFTDWHKFSVPLKSNTRNKNTNCWKEVGKKNCADENTIKEVLADVADLRIRGDYWAGDDYSALDEVKITKKP
jgi:hypothetical protein